MDLKVSKGKRGRPKGSKNKPKNDGSKTPLCREDSRSLEENGDNDPDIVSQMQSFRNSILEHLKVELFGKGKDSSLKTPPLNISSMLSTSFKSHSQSLSFRHNSDTISKDDAKDISCTLNKTAVELLPKKRGRKKLSKNISQSVLKSTFHPNDNNHSAVHHPLECTQPLEVEADNKSQDRNHYSPATKPLLKQTTSIEEIRTKQSLSCSTNEKCPDKMSLDDKMRDNSLREQSGNNVEDLEKVNSVSPKLMAVEKVFQSLMLSPHKVSLLPKNGSDESVLAHIFTKGQIKSSNNMISRKSLPSKLIFSDQIISSYSKFCKRRMVKRQSQLNESKVLLDNLNGCINAPSQNNLLFGSDSNQIIENMNKHVLASGNCNDSKSLNNSSYRKNFSNKQLVDKSPISTLRSLGVQCENVPSSSEGLQTYHDSFYRNIDTQTDGHLSRQMSDASVQTSMISSHELGILCSKCSGFLGAADKDGQNLNTPLKSNPTLTSSFFGNLNFSKLDGLLGNPSVIGEVPTNNNNNITLNVPSSFFDSAFINDLLVGGTPSQKQVREINPPLSSNSHCKVSALSNINNTSMTNQDDKNLNTVRSNSTYNRNPDKTRGPENCLERDETCGDIPVQKSHLFDVEEDVIIRGSMMMLDDAKSGNHIQEESSVAVSEQSKTGINLDEGFINESCEGNQRLRPEESEVSGGGSVILLSESHSSKGSKKRKLDMDDDVDEGDDDDGDFVVMKHKKRIYSLSTGKGYGIWHRGSIEKSEIKERPLEDSLQKTKLKSPTYKKIRRCIYIDAKPTCKDYEPHSCDCKVKQPCNPKEVCCTDSCLNRLVYTECHPSTCPTGDRCSNRRIQKRQWVEGLMKFQTRDRGFGVKALKSLSPGQFIIEYCGEVVSESEFRRRMAQNYRNERHHYCLNLDSGMVIDGYRMGNISRFINHSCQPNCVMEKWNVNGVYRMGLFAIEKIEPGMELTYDYNFHSYNILSQQICKCGSQNCRGVMAGKNQRIKKNERILPASGKHSSRKVKPGYLKRTTTNVPISLPLTSIASVGSKTSSTKEKVFAQKQRLFLQRNVIKVMKKKASLKFNKEGIKSNGKQRRVPSVKDYGRFLKNLPGFENMFSFSKKTHTRTILSTTTNKMKQEGKLRTIFTTIINTLSDIDAGLLYENHPSLRSLMLSRVPNFKETIQEPLSLDAILSNVHLAHYKSFQDFNEDINKLLDHIQKEEIFNPDVEDALLNVRRVYKEASRDVISLFSDIALKPLSPLGTEVNQTRSIEDKHDSEHRAPCESDVVNDSLCNESKKGDDNGEVEVIRCICNIYKDEGLMIQCEKCEKWQHCMCMNVKGDEDSYMCELCLPRPISKEVLLIPQPEDALAHCRYYMTLMRDEQLQVRVGDCVYVTREGSNIDLEVFRSHKNVNIIKEQLDIFRVERLWRKYNGDGCAFGHYYMRPHETFHEANRKFYPNEVFRAPLYHVVPIEAIVGTCCVMDPVTFCKGHPIGIRADDLYVCEFRVDKAARLFSKINKSQHVINTNSYCFYHYPAKLKPKRTYMVHHGDSNGQNTSD